MIYMSGTNKKELDYTLEFDGPSEAIDYYGVPPVYGTFWHYDMPRLRAYCRAKDVAYDELSDEELARFRTTSYTVSE